MTMPDWGLGTLVALVVLIVCVVLVVAGTSLTPHTILGLIAALAIARLT